VIDLAEARLLIDCGIRYLGVPLVLDHHREDLTTDAAAAIVSELGGHVACRFIEEAEAGFAEIESM
jgi:hypothetical protein